MPLDNRARKPASRHRFRDVSNMKLMDIFKPLRRRRLRREVSQRSTLTYSRSCPLAGHALPVPSPSVSLFTSSAVRYRSDAVSILSTTEEECSSGMSTPSVGFEGPLSGVETSSHFSPRPVPTFPTSPSMFQLRSTSTKDYLVERLEQHLRQLSLGDASPDRIAVSGDSPSRDISMDVCLDVSLPRKNDLETSSRRAPFGADALKSMSSPHDQNDIPMILITSADAKHAKPLPPSSRRPSRTPFASSNVANRLTNVQPAKPKPKALPDDLFTTQLHVSAYPTDYSLSFPSFPPTPSNYDPETPTPMCCDHFGDCRGDLWEILHPPLVAGRFTLPPFKFPPLSTHLFDDTSVPLPY